MKKRLFSLGLAVVMALSLSVSAFAAGDFYQSGETSYSVGGYDYKGWSELYTGGGFQAMTCVREKNNQPMPARYMGVTARLFDRYGELIDSKQATYNNEGDSSWMNRTDWITAEGTAYSMGQIHLYTGSTFWTFNAPRTVVAGSARSVDASLAQIAAQLTDEGGYPVNANGKTYGSALLAEEVGYEPELISAVGVYGVRGYVRAADLTPDVNTPDEAQAYMEANTSASWIPLYDVDENVIGVFELGAAQPGDDLETYLEAEAAEARAKAAAVQEQPPQGMALNYSASPYPVNSLGLTYGIAGNAGLAGKRPDLLAARNQAGQRGYIRTWQEPTLNHPSEVEVFLKATENIPYYVVPLYDSECNVIGNFIMHGNGPSMTQEEIDAALSRQY